MLVNLVHKFPRTTLLVCNFLNFVIKESVFCGLDYALEQFSIIQTSCYPIVIQSTIAFFTPPTFGMFHNLGLFSV